MTDANEIIHALRLWFQAGDVFEVRVLYAVSADWMRPHTESGYFDYEHIPDAAAAIGKLRAYRGAYATVNPVKPELLARAWNRIRPVLKEPTTADSEVLARRWLLIDCDPKRASGVSWTIFLFSRKILSTSKWRIFRVSKGGAFSLLEKFSVRNWNFILPQKEFEHRKNGRKEIRTSGLYTRPGLRKNQTGRLSFPLFFLTRAKILTRA